MPLPPKTGIPVRKTMSEEIFDRLLDAIIGGELEPGEHLNDKKLSEWLGGSRTPIREALRRLANLGLVEMVPNKFTRVAPINEPHLIQVADTVYALTELAARESIGRLEADTVAYLSGVFEEICSAGSNGDRRKLTDACYDYFLTLSRQAGNPLLAQTITNLSPQLLRALSPRSTAIDPEVIPGRFEPIHRAVLAGDAEAGAAAVYALTATNRESFRANAQHAITSGSLNQ